MRKIIALLVCALIIGVGTALALVSEPGVSSAQRENVTKALETLSNTTGQTLVPTDIQSTPISSLLQVTANSRIFYVSTDGKYVVAGEILDLSINDPAKWSLTEKSMRGLRAELLESVPEKDMIIFHATTTKIGTVMVFTDIDCSFCQRMHSQIKEYNDLGIEVRYLAFPRSGPGSPSFNKAITVWCTSDRQEALTLAKQGKDLPINICENNPVAMEFELGQKLGVSGTPTVFFSNGDMIPGYIPPQDLQQILVSEANLG